MPPCPPSPSRRRRRSGRSYGPGALPRGGEPGVTRLGRRRGVHIGPCVLFRRSFGGLDARRRKEALRKSRRERPRAGPVSRPGAPRSPFRSSCVTKGRAPTSSLSLSLPPSLSPSPFPRFLAVSLALSLSPPVPVSPPEDVGPDLPSGVADEYPKVSKTRSVRRPPRLPSGRRHRSCREPRNPAGQPNSSLSPGRFLSERKFIDRSRATVSPTSRRPEDDFHGYRSCAREKCVLN